MSSQAVVNPYIWGTGRRKSSVARVRVREGSGNIIVNKKDLNDYFPLLDHQLKVRAALIKTKTEKKYDIFVNVNGGGVSGQAGAILLGIARALVKTDQNLEKDLRDAGFLTRDPRMKERKKYGRKGARASFQFSKR